MATRRVLAALLLPLSLLVAVAVPAPAQAVAVAAPARVTVTPVTVTVPFRAVQTLAQTLPGGHVYGSNLLEGVGSWAGKRTKVRFQALVDYVDGSGPFHGLVTMTRSDGTVLSFSTSGSALATGTGTRFVGAVSVIGGTGAFVGARGQGTLSGSRTAALGGAVRLTFSLAVVR